MEQIKNLLNQAINSLFNVKIEVELTRPDVKFGDFATNVAMQLANQLNQDPREIATKIIDEIKHAPGITSSSVAGPGFINITVSDQVLLRQITTNKTQKASSRVVIETNNPNPFKAMHIGHAFNAVVADTIANLLEVSGNETHRVSYHGDVGAHVGKSMYSLLKYVDGDANKLKLVKPEERNSFMSRMYAEGAQAYKKDSVAKQKIDDLARKSFVPDEPLYKEVYETCIDWSFQQIDDLVAKLGNKPIEKRYLESQAEDLGVKTVKEHTGDVFFESEGALVFPGEKYGTFNNVFVGSNGFGLYGARDLGLIQLKNADYNPESSYIVTAEEQRDYFKGVIKAAQLCFPDSKSKTINIPTGTVKLTTGKMSSRNGEVLEVGWLFEQIAQVLQKYDANNISAVVTSAIRYQFLKVRVGSDIVFDIEDAANLQGNTGPYLQYSYARAASILKKVDYKVEKSESFDQDEHILLLKISEYQEVINRAITELMPHHVANYLYELTQEFNRFYEKNRVLGDEREGIRINLLRHYCKALGQGLSVLGIPVLEKM